MTIQLSLIPNFLIASLTKHFIVLQPLWWIILVKQRKWTIKLSWFHFNLNSTLLWHIVSYNASSLQTYTPNKLFTSHLMWFGNVHLFAVQMQERVYWQWKHLKLAHNQCPGPLATSWGLLIRWEHSFHWHQTVDCDCHPLHFLTHWNDWNQRTVLLAYSKQGFLLKHEIKSEKNSKWNLTWQLIEVVIISSMI